MPTQSRKLPAAPGGTFRATLPIVSVRNEHMQIHRTVLLWTAAFAASSLNGQVATSQVNIPIRTTVTVNSGRFFDRVVLSGSMKLTAQNNSTGSCQVQQPGGLC